MSEFVLALIDQPDLFFNATCQGNIFRASFQSFQIDDQHSQTPTPVVVFGRHSSQPFFELTCLFPPQCFSTILYLSASFQRLDVCLNPSFLSDVISLTKTIQKSDIIQSSSTKPEKLKQIFNIHWIDISPLYIVFSMENIRGRTTLYDPINPYFRLIPTIKSKPITLPGFLITNFSDTLSELITRVEDDWKTVAFQQFVLFLGMKGKVLTSFGLIGNIAHILHIQLHSELTSDISIVHLKEFQNFDNRTEVVSCICQRALQQLKDKLNFFQMKPSKLLEGLYNLENTGLQMNPTNHVLTSAIGFTLKTNIDVMSTLQSMQDVQTLRIPRAFPGNVISSFDSSISLAQDLIQTKLKISEKVRFFTICQKSKDYVCITDQYVCILSPSFKEIKTEILMTSIKKARAVSVDVRIDMHKALEEISFRCSNENHAVSFCQFINSQRYMIQLFQRSFLS